MEPYRKRLHLDRSELLLVSGLVVLIAGLMFTLGVMVGFGLQGRVAGVSDASGHETSAASEGHGAHAKSVGETSKRKPASEGDAEKVEVAPKDLPGGELRKAFREAKQRSLVELSLREAPSNKPKSVLDAEAHFEAHEGWNRKPASAEEVSDNDKGSSKVPGVKDPAKVKALFERKPSSLDRFSPTPGGYTVQIASYATADESTMKVTELRKLGFNDAYVQTIKLKNGEQWFRVAVGSYPSPVWAKKEGDKLVRRKLATDYVVRQVN